MLSSWLILQKFTKTRVKFWVRVRENLGIERENLREIRERKSVEIIFLFLEKGEERLQSDVSNRTPP